MPREIIGRRVNPFEINIIWELFLKNVFNVGYLFVPLTKWSCPLCVLFLKMFYAKFFLAKRWAKPFPDARWARSKRGDR